MSLGRIAIVGAGAIGSYYGARLAQAGHDVTFLLRSDFNHVSKHGLEIQSCAGDFRLSEVQCARTSDEIGEVDLVIVAWKTTANAQAQSIITPLIGQNTAILTLQNGLGNAEHLAETFGAERIIGGLCFVCINRLQPGVISHTASGLIRIGEFDGKNSLRLAKIANIFNGANFTCEAVDSLEKALWMKLVWNYPFNGLAIVEGGVDTEILLKDRQLEPKIRSIMAEVVAIAKALGHEIPKDFIDNQIAITLKMDQYQPSSMIDYVNGLPVEYEAIWENPLKVARKVGVPVPAMEALAVGIKACLDARDFC